MRQEGVQHLRQVRQGQERWQQGQHRHHGHHGAVLKVGADNLGISILKCCCRLTLFVLVWWDKSLVRGRGHAVALAEVG